MSGTAYTIRAARPEDADAVAELWSLMAAQHETYDRFRWAHAADAAASWREHFLKKLQEPQSVALVAVDAEDRPVGYLMGGTAEPPPTMAIRCRGEVGDLFVLPRRHRQGIGKALMTEAERMFKSRGAAYMMLNVAVANRKARAFYKALGMQPMVQQMYKKL